MPFLNDSLLERDFLTNHQSVTLGTLLSLQILGLCRLGTNLGESKRLTPASLQTAPCTDRVPVGPGQCADPWLHIPS